MAELLPPQHVASSIERLLEERFPGIRISSIDPMTPDASQRRYFRVNLEPGCHVFGGAPQRAGNEAAGTPARESCVAMFFDSVSSPEASGATAIDADDAYVELSHFFSDHGVAVPALIVDAREQALLVIEDLGDVNLAACVLQGHPSLDTYCDLALEQIAAIQRIGADERCIAFRRGFSADQYVREMSEFDDFLLKPRGTNAENRAKFQASTQQLADELGSAPRVLVHRDYHGWNLLVHRDRIRVIDFQDALLATRPYDLVSLLNDRDMDSLLGVTRYVRLVKQFASLQRDPNSFMHEYDLVLLQRDIKVAGRFAKLSAVRGLKQYEQWIPGTIRRIGRTLERLVGDPNARFDAAGLLELLLPALPEIGEGRDTPLRFT